MWDVFIADTKVRSLRELGGSLGPSVWKEAVMVVSKDRFCGKRAVQSAGMNSWARVRTQTSLQRCGV
jgi:hypothetical protein